MSPADFPSKPVTFGGHSFLLHGINSEDGYWRAIDNDLDLEFLNLSRRLILPDYNCLDVGANIGTKSLFLSRHCHDGKVISIEAGPRVADCLAANVAANAAFNVSIERTAIGDHIGKARFVEISAWGHLQADGESQQNTLEVPITTLDEIVARHDLSSVDFIKIDTEGAEFSILKSSLQLINRFESLVLVEFNAYALTALANVNPRGFVDWLLNNFTYVFAVNRGGTGDLLRRYSKNEAIALLHRNLVEDRCVTDILITNAEGRLRPSLSWMEGQVSSLTLELARVSGELARISAERDQLTAERAQLTAEKAQLMGDTLELARVSGELARASADRAELTAELEALVNSRSWRLTRPLRRLRELQSRLNVVLRA